MAMSVVQVIHSWNDSFVVLVTFELVSRQTFVYPLLPQAFQVCQRRDGPFECIRI